MKDDFGCFGSRLEGYVQYNEAFNCIIASSVDPESTFDVEVSDMYRQSENLFRVRNLMCKC